MLLWLHQVTFASGGWSLKRLGWDRIWTGLGKGSVWQGVKTKAINPLLANPLCSLPSLNYSEGSLKNVTQPSTERNPLSSKCRADNIISIRWDEFTSSKRKPDKCIVIPLFPFNNLSWHGFCFTLGTKLAYNSSTMAENRAFPGAMSTFYIAPILIHLPIFMCFREWLLLASVFIMFNILCLLF